MEEALWKEVTTHLAGAGRTLMLNRWGRDRALPAVFIAVSVLRHYGYRALPMPVDATYFNDEAVEEMELGATEQDIIDASHTINVPGAPHASRLGFNRPSTYDPGCHVVVALPEQGHLLDIAADAAACETADMAVEPFLISAHDVLFWRSSTGTHTTAMPQHGAVTYRRRALAPGQLSGYREFARAGEDYRMRKLFAQAICADIDSLIASRSGRRVVDAA